MSMYTQLLAAAVDVTKDPDTEPTTSAALAQVLRCRHQLGSGGPTGDGEGAYAMVVDSLAYDAALIELARLVGIGCDVESFDPPLVARARLEQELAAAGIRLDDLDEQKEHARRSRDERRHD